MLQCYRDLVTERCRPYMNLTEQQSRFPAVKTGPIILQSSPGAPTNPGEVTYGNLGTQPLVKWIVIAIHVTFRLLPISVGLLVLPCTRQCRRSPLLPPLLFFVLSRTEEPVPVPVTGVRYNSLLWMCMLNTLTWPDVTYMLSFRNAKTVDLYVNRRVSENQAITRKSEWYCSINS